MEEKIIINAEDSVLGRLASFAAKQALQGNEIMVLNCEKAIISGKKKSVLEQYRKKIFRKRGTTIQSIQKTPESIMRRAIRGMLPWKKTHGKEAFRKIKCFQGIPEEYKEKKMQMLERKEIEGITLKELCRIL